MIPRTNIKALREKYAKENYIAVSMDIDWASDPCIRRIVDYFLGQGAPLTIFCTHPSEAVDAYRGHPGVELGIHPNFFAQSSQGGTMDEVIDYCLKLAPGARCVRGHRWYSSNDMYDRLVERGIRFDSNESSMLDLAEPYIHRSGILRIPVFFEDGGFLWNGAAMDFKKEGLQYFDCPGLKVLDLHPIHFALNCPDNAFYRNVADGLPRAEYAAMTEETIARIAYKGYGMRDYIMELMDFVKRKDVRLVSLGQVYGDLVYYEGGPES